ncbi:ribonuclease R [Tichowtungia aerotolerans]|uniref:Ribonuclease R n=1 Tax=Tichowtungia aerotolerans TaxID=2697043 RepID=A0A6P1M223_9BACT|nr:ribonuclease R [Tichowtungia aerotolerans]QHI68640.1 ribonuclease R [Tichowtungia aerotolerans]
MKQPSSKKAGLQERILKHMSNPKYRPLSRPDLAKAMRIHSKERNQLRQALINLETAGKVVSLRKNRWALPETRDTIAGIVRVTDKGFGIFTPDCGKEEFYIAKDDLKCALHEDRVSIERLPAKKPPRGRPAFRNPEGRVVSVLERKAQEVVGLLKRTPYYAYVIPDNLRLGHDVRVADVEKELGEIPDDHKVVIRLNEWDDPFKPLSGTVIEDIGHSDDPNVEMQCILRAHGFRQNFSEEVLAEAEKMPHELRPEDYEGRTDLRERLTFTIDPETARDFDDAISLEKVSNGWKLSVHIADVAHFVPKNSAIDKEALHRGNSIYLVDRVVMMIPPELTTKICSLNPNVDRLAHTVEMTITENGQMVAAQTCRSIIHSDARLNYDQVQALFDGETDDQIPASVVEALKALRPLIRTIRKLRTDDDGSLELDTPQIKCILGKDGKVASIEKGEAKEAYQLIEECMLLANVAVARKLKEAQWPAIHRIHEEPDAEMWAQMGAELQALGIDALPATRADINAVLEKVAGHPMEYSANMAILTNLKRAGYSAEPAGHFGLAFDDYVHFTSPIRRYPDLVVHRLLTALEQNGKQPYRSNDIEAIAAQCTRTETEADAAEKESIALRRAEYYRDLLYKGETGPYTACVIKVLGKGLLIELEDTLQRGLVAFSSITDDRYELNASKTKATGTRWGKSFQIGDEIEVDLVKVDVQRNFVDFHLTGQEQFSAKKKGKPQRRKKGKKQTVAFNGNAKYGKKPKKRRNRK